MATETITIDPAATPLELANGADGFLLRSISTPTPSRKRIEATSSDTEGSLPIENRYDNRSIDLVIRAIPSASRSAWHTKLDKLQQKIAKINAEGGQLKRVLIGGNQFFFDLVDAEANVSWDNARYALRMDTDITVKFTAMPFCYGSEQTLGDHTETTLPCLIFTETAIIGDVPATARLVVDNDSANGWWWTAWGGQCEFYNSSVDASLFYEAEALTPVGGSVQARAGASGGNVVRSGNLGLNTYTDILSTQKTGGGNFLAHLGGYRVYARVWNEASGNVTLAFAYTNGDGYAPFKVNGGVAVTTKAKYALVDLGLIYLQPISGASLQWRGKVIGKSDTAANQIDIDALFFMPVSEGSGKAQAMQSGEALVFPGRSMQFRSDGTLRQDSTGTVLVPVTSGASGDLFKIPPAGLEARTVRLFIKASRGLPLGDTGGKVNPSESGDPSIDDISARVYYTPRWLMAPG